MKKLKDFFSNNNEDISQKIEDEEKMETQERYEQIQDDLELILQSSPLGSDGYSELDDTFYNLLNEKEYEDYQRVKQNFFENKKETMSKELGIENTSIMTFTEFMYFYLSKTTNSYFYENLALRYTLGFKELLNKENIELSEINWDNISEKEEKYEEVLIDILLSKINNLIRPKNKILFGIDIGLGSKLFFVRDKQSFYEIKRIDTNFYFLYDEEYLQNFYNSLYELTEDIDGTEPLSKGDFVEERSKTGEVLKVKSLFKTNNKEYDIKSEKLNQIFQGADRYEF